MKQYYFEYILSNFQDRTFAYGGFFNPVPYYYGKQDTPTIFLGIYDGKLEKLITFQTPGQNLEILKEIVFNGYTTAKFIDSFSIGQGLEAEHLLNPCSFTLDS